LRSPERFPDNKAGPRTPFSGNLSQGLPSGPAQTLTATSEAEARARLHSCLQDIAAAQAEVDRVKRAEAIVEQKRIAASAKAGRAERALTKARKAVAPIDVAGAILAGNEPAPSSVHKAKTALDAADAEWERYGRQLKQLEPEILAAKRSLSVAENARDAAIAEIVALGVGPLLDEYRAVARRLAEVENVLEKINGNGCGLLVNSTGWNILPKYWDGKRSDFRPDQTLASLWRDAIGSLKQDHESALPGQTPAGRKRLAA
jgi:hypothetical protein